MKHLLLIPALLIAFSAQAQTVDRKACQTAYSNTITTCAKGLDALAPNVRAGAQKACVQGAQLARDVCLAGTGPAVCQESCQASYQITANQCEVAYNTQYPLCGISLICQANAEAIRANCQLAATDVLNNCVAGCGVAP